MPSPTFARQLPIELAREAELTGSRYVVVEGQDDQRFLEVWLESLELDRRVNVVPVERIELDFSILFERGLTDGKRGHVIVVANILDDHAARILCIADLDVGQELDGNLCDALVLTDFPSLESYALEPKTFDIANKIQFRGKLPPTAELLSALGFALRELFAVRQAHPHLPSPNYSAGLPGDATLADFDVALTVAPHISKDCAEFARPENDDLRAYAYGHDISRLLFAAYKNQLKAGAGIGTVEAIESCLRSAMLASGEFATQPLYQKLLAWGSETQRP